MGRILDVLFYGLLAGIFLAEGCSGSSVSDIEGNAEPLNLTVFTDVQGTSGTGSAGTAGDAINSIGVYVTGESDHVTYPGTPAEGIVFSRSGSAWTSTPGIIVNGTKGRLYAWWPVTGTFTPDAGSGKHSIPVTIPSTQISDGGNDWALDGVTDYLYGAGNKATASSSTIIVSSHMTTPAIYMQHALAQVVFNVQYDSRTPAANNYVKSIKLTDSKNSFLAGSGSMQVGNGALTGLSATNVLEFVPGSGTEQAVGTTSVTVARGLVAPLALVPSVTMTVILGTKGDNANDRVYTLTSSGINVQWGQGYRYIYNLKLGNYTQVDQTAVPWGSAASDTPVTPEEQGIGSGEKLIAFASLWNQNGDKGDQNKVFYKDYGWEEIDETGNKTFKIKLTGPIKLTATNLDDILWQPIGTAAKPLTIPFDGQGWQIAIDLTGVGTAAPAGKLPGEYAGVIGYTRSDICNVRISNVNSSTVEFTEARYAGLLAGKVTGNIMNCTVELNGVALVNSCKTISEPMYMGGMVGSCSGRIVNSAVYANTSSSLSIGFEQASVNSYLGGIAGDITGGSMNNCYSRVTQLSNGSASNLPFAGILAGNYATGAFSNCHYITGVVMSNCTERDYSGIAAGQADFVGLCDSLNGIAEANDWAVWTEKKESAGPTVTSVFLFKYRNEN